MSRTLTHLDALESEAIHIMREVAAELEKPVLLFSGGKDSIVLLRLAEKAFRPGKFPFPLMHVDTGHNFPEVIEYRDRRVAELGERLIVASVQESIDAGRVGRGDGRARVAQPPADDHAARRDRGARLRRRLRRRAPRRGARPREGAHLLLPRRLRRLGPARASAPSCGTSTTAACAAARTSACSRSPTGPSSTCGVHRARGPRAAVDLLRARARGLPPRRDALRRRPDFIERRPDEEPFVETVRYRTVGDMSCTGAVRSDAGDARRRRRRDRRHRVTERGETRADDRVSEAAMEDRKVAGYF